jgi:hypothetical protein
MKHLFGIVFHTGFVLNIHKDCAKLQCAQIFCRKSTLKTQSKNGKNSYLGCHETPVMSSFQWIDSGCKKFTCMNRKFTSGYATHFYLINLL